jgi:ABC-type multidrug transport system fused ATPase/permease subunit
MKEKKSKKQLIFDAHSYMWQITKNMHGRYFVHVFLIAIGQMLAIALAYSIGKGIDITVGTTDSVVPIVLVILVISVMRAVFAITEATYHINKIAYDLDRTIELYTMSKLFRFSPGQASRENTGLKMDTLQKGSSAVAELMTILFTNIIPISIKTIVSLAILFYISWMIGSIILVSICLFSIVSVKVNNYYADEFRRVRKIESNVETKYWEIIKHLKLVIIMAMQSKTFNSYKDSKVEVQKEGSKVWSRYNIFVGYTRNLPFEHLMMGLIFLIIFVSVRKNDISVGDVAIVISLIGTVFSSINSIGTLQRQIMRHSINVLRLKDLVEQEPECVDIPDAVEIVNPIGDIRFADVSFSYEKGKTHALKNVSFHIRHGETVAFVGHSGSGKSTIISLILRAHTPQQGEIFVDDLPLNSVAIASWRSRIGVVSQQVMLWDDTLKENVLYGSNREIDESRLDEILRGSRIDEFYDRLGEKGRDSLIGENGTQLSGGQSQRVAIARVLARDPRLVIFDEATSALDYKTEAEVFQAMNRALEGRTGILVAHRLGTVKRANRIFVLHKGEIVGEGSYEELSKNNEHFKELIGSEIK